MSVTTEAIVVLGVFALSWGWIIYEMHIAPEVDDKGNVVKPKSEFDITEEDINGDLKCMYGQEED